MDNKKMTFICSDLEGVFFPEVWIKVAEKTGIEELKITTKDEPDYDKLMKMRLQILKDNDLKMKDIQEVIDTIEPFDGAVEFLDWLRTKSQVVIVSDTFKQFADMIMPKLRYPTVLCHSLSIDEDGNITDYNLRQEMPKKQVVKALKALNYNILAFGDSYNDTQMLEEADVGMFFCPPEKVANEFPQYKVAKSYDELKEMLEKHL